MGVVVDKVIDEHASTTSSSEDGGCVVVLEVRTSSNSSSSDDGGGGSKIELSASKEERFWCIGRQASCCHVRITHKSISRQHAALYFVDKDLYVHDLGGKHGSYVNQKKVDPMQSQMVQHGDLLSFGNTQKTPTFLLHIHQPPSSSSVSVQPSSLALSFSSTKNNNNHDDDDDDGLTGRAKREAEIAAAMASFDETPTMTYNTTKPTTTISTTTLSAKKTTTTTSKKSSCSQIPPMLPVTDCLWLEPSEVQADLRSSSSSSSSSQRSKVVLTSVAWDASGTRLVLGSSDAVLRFYDVSQKVSCFQQVRVCPSDLHTPIVDLQFNLTGSQLLVGTTSAQPLLLSRDGTTLMEFAKGDVYIQYHSQTTIGHTSSVTAVAWHPISNDICLTASIDGTVRTWNVRTGKTQFQKLCNTTTYQPSTKQRQAMSNALFLNASQIIASTQQGGTCYIWNTSTPHRPIHTIHTTLPQIQHLSKHFEHSHIALSHTNNNNNNNNGEIQIWSTSTTSSSFTKPTLVQTYNNNSNNNTTTTTTTTTSIISSNVCFGSTTRDTKHIICYGTNNGTLQFHNVHSSGSQQRLLHSHSIPPNNNNTTTTTTNNNNNVSIVKVLWHTKLNQIVCTLSDGNVCLFYSPTTSRNVQHYPSLQQQQQQRFKTTTNNDLQDLYRQRAKQAPSIQTTTILTPLDHNNKRRKLQQLEENNAILPHPPATGIAQGDATSANLNFTQHVVSSRIPKLLSKDPRTDLFQYHNANQNDDKDKRKFGLDSSQPTILASKTVEQEQDELQQQQQQQQQ